MPRLKLSIDILGEEVELVVDAKMVDNGIGAYEYWGAKGTHHSYEAEWEVVSTNPPIDLDRFYEDEKLLEEVQREVEKLLDRISEEGEMGADRREED